MTAKDCSYFYVPEKIIELSNSEAFYYGLISFLNLIKPYVSLQEIKKIIKYIEGNQKGVYINNTCIKNLVNSGIVKLKKVKKRTPAFYGQKSVELYKKAISESKNLNSFKNMPVWREAYTFNATSKIQKPFKKVPSGVLTLKLSKQKKGLLIKLFSISAFSAKAHRSSTYNNIAFIAKLLENSVKIYENIKEIEKTGILIRKKDKILLNHVFMPEFILEDIESILTKNVI